MLTLMTGPYVRIDEGFVHFSDYEIDSLSFSRFLDDELELSLRRKSPHRPRASVGTLPRLWAALRFKVSTLASRQWK